MSGASGGGQLATVNLITALTSITNAVAVSGIAGTVTVAGSLTSIGSITNPVTVNGALTSVGTITNPVTVNGALTSVGTITNPVTVNGALTSVGSITNTVVAKRDVGATIQYFASAITNATATLVSSATSLRRSAMIKNITPGVTFYIGSNSAVTAANGFPVEYGEVLILSEAAKQSIYAYQNSGASQSLRVIMELD